MHKIQINCKHTHQATTGLVHTIITTLCSLYYIDSAIKLYSWQVNRPNRTNKHRTIQRKMEISQRICYEKRKRSIDSSETISKRLLSIGLFCVCVYAVGAEVSCIRSSDTARPCGQIKMAAASVELLPITEIDLWRWKLAAVCENVQYFVLLLHAPFAHSFLADGNKSPVCVCVCCVHGSPPCLRSNPQTSTTTSTAKTTFPEPPAFLCAQLLSFHFVGSLVRFFSLLGIYWKIEKKKKSGPQNEPSAEAQTVKSMLGNKCFSCFRRPICTKHERARYGINWCASKWFDTDTILMSPQKFVFLFKMKYVNMMRRSVNNTTLPTMTSLDGCVCVCVCSGRDLIFDILFIKYNKWINGTAPLRHAPREACEIRMIPFHLFANGLRFHILEIALWNRKHMQLNHSILCIEVRHLHLSTPKKMGMHAEIILVHAPAVQLNTEKIKIILTVPLQQKIWPGKWSVV